MKIRRRSSKKSRDVVKKVLILVIETLPHIRSNEEDFMFRVLLLMELGSDFTRSEDGLIYFVIYRASTLILDSSTKIGSDS